MTSRGRVTGAWGVDVGRHSRHRWLGVAAVVTVAALLGAAGCTVSGQPAAVPVSARPGAIDSAVTLASLESAPESGCALPAVSQAVRSAGLTPAGEPTGTTDALNPETKLTGVAAQCDVSLTGGGSVEILLVAANQPAAVAVTMPLLQRDAALSIAQLEPLVDAAVQLPAGRFVDVPGTAPVTVSIVTVSGAVSAALLVAATAGPTRDQTTALAKALAGG